jgi:hypothetical protein
MKLAAAVPATLAAILFTAACGHVAGPARRPAAKAAAAEPEALTPSPRLIVGRIIAVDAARQFAFVELAPDAPAAALAAGTELTCRTVNLQQTAQLEGSRQVRGRTFGTKILAGQPSPGDEVVWLAP